MHICSFKYRNPFPGQLFNSPTGSNVHQGLRVDYNGEVGKIIYKLCYIMTDD
jgi:hypothetical protein